MLARLSDPIVAIATAPGRGAVGIVRVSGRALQPLIEAVCGRSLQPRHATLLPFVDREGRAIDEGLALHFPAPHSYTGEDVLELHAHGGSVVLQLLLARCLEAAAQPNAGGRARLPHLRLADPGEFTTRAFVNGKLDLAQAEAVADLIDAGTEAAARSAARSLTGAFSDEIGALAAAIVELRTLVEATLDFPDEEIDFLQRADALGRLQRIDDRLQGVLAGARRGALLSEGLHVVLAGQPNVGKSSLLNALAGAELAIVTPIPGTTRDRIAQTIQIEGVPLHIVDTAGLRAASDAADEVERIGIARTWTEIGRADVVLLLHDLTRLHEVRYRVAQAAIEAELDRLTQAPRLQVFNKCDAAAVPAAPSSAGAVVMSALTGQGLEELRAALLRLAGWQPAADGGFIARTRHVQALRVAAGHLARAREQAAQGDAALELFAEELRLAHEALGAITGTFTSEDLLGQIFGRFCIGK
ncbi:MAG: tRNA uridine-5-carboxymethylaminomethyl(34) synthesis GTPase MnmE [Ideonella sp.]|nr:tRNA uridine-5-carboxymethylaminomethyl(34) synthesis GTPase MnmE [Ideonella sp.]MCC7457572.1 tRNA uridine-5-carboxymethylaminomethyl(34) synthesis GTPase MnmE [Nitrospira sp.]